MAVNKNFIVKKGLEVNDSAVIHGVLIASGIRYPTIDGNNGDVIKTNGSGSLSFGKLALGDLSDIDLQDLEENGILAYDSASSKWLVSTEITTDINSDGGFY